MFNINDYKEKINTINTLLVEENSSTNKLISQVSTIILNSKDNQDVKKLKNKLIRKIIEE